MLKAYIQKDGIQMDDEFSLFCPIANLKSDRLRAAGILTYGRMWELLKAKLDKL